MDKQELYKKAITQWGATNQMDMVVEECAELIQAINKVKRDGSIDNEAKLCGEIADVEIMIEQLRLIINKNEHIEQIKEYKLMRLNDRLNKRN